MKQFLYTVAGVLVGGFLLFLIPLLLICTIGAIAGGSQNNEVKDGSVLVLDLSTPIEDRSANNASSMVRNLINGDEPAQGLNEIIEKLAEAESDSRICALLLEGRPSSDYAILTELRNALLNFKANSNKPIYYYANSASNAAIYVASVADSILVSPQGAAELTGVGMQKTYFLALADKLGIGFDVIKHGKYKSAVEPYYRYDMSPEDREQSERLVNTLWSSLRDSIASSRGISPDSIDSYIDNLEYTLVQNAIRLGIITRTAYRDELIADLKKECGTDEDKALECVDMAKYTSDNTALELADDHIAVVYATGQILDGTNKNDLANIYGDDLAQTLRTVRADSSIKAVVLRVNSPGGSALASDIIWREVTLLKKDKPVVVSMSGYAASGGYYISCAANRIVAQPTTLTGSIGVFGYVPNAAKLANNIGVSFQSVRSNKNQPEIGTQPLTPQQFDAITASIEDIYTAFVSRVAEGRGMTTDAVDSLGQGRVWSGIDAQNNGLVDELGGLDDAIEIAAELAQLEDFDIVDYPKVKTSPLDAFISIGIDAKAIVGESLMGDQYTAFDQLRKELEGGKVCIKAVCDVTVK